MNSKLTRKRKAGPVMSVDDKLAKLESRRKKLLIDKQIQDLRAQKKTLS